MIKKLSSHLTPLKVFVFCCFLTILVIGACEKNDTDQPSQQKELEEWYSRNKPKTRASYFDDLKPKWETAYIIEPTSELIVYEMQVSNPKNVYQKLSDDTKKDASHSGNNIRFLLFKDKVTGKILTGCYMSILNEGPESKDLKKIHYKQVGDLSGKIMFFNMLGILENGWQYIDGKLAMRINGSLDGYYFGSKKAQLGDLKNPVVSGTVSRYERLMTYSPPTCAFPQPDWRTSCVGVDGYMECTTYLAGYFCVDQTPGGGGEGGYNPYPGNPGHGGGGGSNPPSVNKDLIDSLQGYPCPQALIKEMKTNICTDIATLIKNTFAKNDLVNITFKADNSLVGTTTDGQETEGNSSLYTAEFNVGLNPDVLNRSSQEYIIATMYHEALHAFFDRKFRLLGEAEFKRQYEGVEVNGGRLLGIFDDDHTPMAYQKYVNGLKDVIMKFNTSFSEDRARILAKGGIIQFLPEEKTINNQERDTTKPGFIGTKCP